MVPFADTATVNVPHTPFPHVAGGDVLVSYREASKLKWALPSWEMRFTNHADFPRYTYLRSFWEVSRDTGDTNIKLLFVVSPKDQYQLVLGLVTKETNEGLIEVRFTYTELMTFTIPQTYPQPIGTQTVPNAFAHVDEAIELLVTAFALPRKLSF